MEATRCCAGDARQTERQAERDRQENRQMKKTVRQEGEGRKKEREGKRERKQANKDKAFSLLVLSSKLTTRETERLIGYRCQSLQIVSQLVWMSKAKDGRAN